MIKTSRKNLNQESQSGRKPTEHTQAIHIHIAVDPRDHGCDGSWCYGLGPPVSRDFWQPLGCWPICLGSLHRPSRLDDRDQLDFSIDQINQQTLTVPDILLFPNRTLARPLHIREVEVVRH